MNTTVYLWSLIAVTAGVTFILRAFPFLLFGSGTKTPSVIEYVGKVLSPAAIAMLAVYCFGCYFHERPLLQNSFKDRTNRFFASPWYIFVVLLLSAAAAPTRKPDSGPNAIPATIIIP